jgi:hypothetical protein
MKNTFGRNYPDPYDESYIDPRPHRSHSDIGFLGSVANRTKRIPISLACIPSLFFDKERSEVPITELARGKS